MPFGSGASAKADGKLRQTLDRQLRHRNAVFEARGRAKRLQRLNSHRGKQNCIEIEGCLGGARYSDVSQMRGVETAPKEGNALSPILLAQAWVHGKASDGRSRFSSAE